MNLSREVGKFVDGEDAAIGARQQTVVHGKLARKLVAAAGGFDGIDIADQVGNRYVGRSQFFNVAMLGTSAMRSASRPFLSRPIRGIGGR